LIERNKSAIFECLAAQVKDYDNKKLTVLDLKVELTLLGPSHEASERREEN
jgi:hypothetical protein